MAESYEDDLEPKSKRDRADFWLNKVSYARNYERSWRNRSAALVARYRDDDYSRQERVTRMNIFYSNVETLQAALYSGAPRARVVRRYRDQDPIGRQAAEIIERALTYQAEQYDLDGELISAIRDYLIVGRGVVRVVYSPTVMEGDNREAVNMLPIFGDMGQQAGMQYMRGPQGDAVDESLIEFDEMGAPFTRGESYEFIADQAYRGEYVHWQDFVIEPSQRWADVNWIAFRKLMTRADLIERFGAAKGNRIPLTHEYDDADTNYSTEDTSQPMRAECYEIWDKRSGKQIFVATGFAEILEEAEDPYQLDGFWPCPEPLYAIKTTDSTIPLPEFFEYEDQVNELDIITQRIAVLTEALKRRGIYDSSFSELTRLADANDNEFIPVDNYAMMQGSGGLSAVMQEADLGTLIQALNQLYNQRQAVIQTIYEITGISDIMRGASASRETATAQRIKGQFGALRLTNRQRGIERFITALYGIKAEMIAENIEPQLLAQMTNLPVGPQVAALLESDRLRGFRLNVETEDSLAVDNATEQQRRVEFLTAMVQYIQAIGPIVAQGALTLEQAKSFLLFAARAFPGARELEDALEAIGTQPPPEKQPDPADKLVEVEAAKVQAQTAKAQADAQVALQKLALDREKAEADINLRQQKLDIDAAKVMRQ